MHPSVRFIDGFLRSFFGHFKVAFYALGHFLTIEKIFDFYTFYIQIDKECCVDKAICAPFFQFFLVFEIFWTRYFEV